MTKTYRQGQILKLIRSKRIGTQEELSQELKSQGIAATQVTLSRDIRDLRLVKTREGYQEMAPEETGPQFALLAAEFLHAQFRYADIPVPEELKQRFRKDPRFKRAFEALTPGRQRSYLYHFGAAKQPATREARIEKAMPAIFEGRGFLERG